MYRDLELKLVFPIPVLNPNGAVQLRKTAHCDCRVTVHFVAVFGSKIITLSNLNTYAGHQSKIWQFPRTAMRGIRI